MTGVTGCLDVVNWGQSTFGPVREKHPRGEARLGSVVSLLPLFSRICETSSVHKPTMYTDTSPLTKRPLGRPLVPSALHAQVAREAYPQSRWQKVVSKLSPDCPSVVVDVGVDGANLVADCR